MKKILYFSLVLILIAFTLDAQKISYTMDNDTVRSDTVQFTPGNTISKYNGIAGFQYETDNGGITNYDTLTAILEGSYDGTDYVQITTQSSPSGKYIISDKDPDALYYQLSFYGTSGDSINIVDITYFYKEE